MHIIVYPSVTHMTKLKINTPNMLKMGRTNQCTLDGPIRLAKGSRELIDRVESLYEAWFKVWQDTVVPKLLFQPKWYDSDKDLLEGDLVYFQKQDGKLEGKWVIGKVEQIIRSERDMKIRRVIVGYRNEKESFGRVTDRSVRKLVKLFSVDDHVIQDDLAELQMRIDALRGESREDVQDDSFLVVESDVGEDDVTSQEFGILIDDQAQGPARNTRSRKCNCCCSSHCGLQFHTLGKKMQPYLVSHANVESCSLDVPVLDVGITTVNGEEEEDDEAELCDDPWKFSSVMDILSSINLGF